MVEFAMLISVVECALASLQLANKSSLWRAHGAFGFSVDLVRDICEDSRKN